MERIIIVCVVVVVLIAAMVAAWCKIAGKESRKEEKEHPCAYCQRWGECNGVDENCPFLREYEETRTSLQSPAFFRGHNESTKWR